MIKTIVWFGCGGFFTACYSNAVRRYPVFRKPGMHVFFTSIGLALGYGMHRFEENAEEIFKKLVKKHKNASWYPPGVLLAERQARLNALKGVEEAAVEIEDEFEDIDDDEEEEEEE